MLVFDSMAFGIGPGSINPLTRVNAMRSVAAMAENNADIDAGRFSTRA